MKIDILVGNNLYGSTTFFAKSLYEALRGQGVDARIFWIDDGFFFQAFYEISNDPPDFTCSFSDIRLEKQPLASLWQIPHLSLLIDPAIYFLHHLKSPFSHVSCVDEEDVSFVHSLGFSNAFFLPHGADEKNRSFGKERPFEKVFFGTCIDIEEISEKWAKAYPPKTVSLLHEASSLVLSPNRLSTLKALTLLGVKEDELPVLHYEVDLYTRGKDRIELLKRENVHIWGSGPWEKFCPKATVHAPINFEEVLSIMKKSKMVFNSSPRFKNGSHERILYALMCGALPITTQSGFVDNHFSKEELLTYEPGVWEISEQLSSLEKMVSLGQEKVLSSHTWQTRAETLLNYARGVKYLTA